jgi:histidinol-phosphatase (PHP family)
MANLLDRHEWDYVIGSVHFLRDRAVDMQGTYDVWDLGERPEKVWRRYFETIAESARSGMYDVIAHPDLVKVWGSGRPDPEGDRRRYYEIAVEAFAETGVAVEVSTSGLRKPVGEIYPARQYLEMVVEAGCPIALSSDAHVPQDVGYGYDRALELLDEVGVRELCVFERRARRLEPIG